MSEISYINHCQEAEEECMIKKKMMINNINNEKEYNKCTLGQQSATVKCSKICM